MILVDTSVWLNHFRLGDNALARLLEDGMAGLHPFVLGEIAAGTLHGRFETLSTLGLLPQIHMAGESEVHHLLESRRLWGTGLGWVDLHLLASAKLFAWNLYTHDRALKAAAAQLSIEHLPA